jgi:hypothetical protein
MRCATAKIINPQRDNLFNCYERLVLTKQSERFNIYSELRASFGRRATTIRDQTTH